MENGAKVTLLSVLAVVGIGIKVLVRASRANRSPSLSSSSSYGDSANERLSGFGNLNSFSVIVDH
ncbi:MAG: hypothetical protein K1X64_10380 [Myxococcaceae bacterium]|nr:hypothetical protein [Myxococcaceae bacterium]